jgi:hypothetical protein
MSGFSARTRVTVALVLTAAVGLLLADSAGAAPVGAHLTVVPAGSIFGSIGGALLGAFSWTVGLASKFILVTLSALIKMLIPRSWAHAPLALFEWVVAVPNYAGTITSPGGSTSFGFAGVNAIRQLFEWIGIGVLPLSLTYATGRSMIGAGDHVAAPIVRVIGLAAVLLSYGWWWGQAAAVVNQLTRLILAPEVVTDGMRQLMAYAVEGTVLGGWQLIDLGLMAALALELLALIVVKVVIVLVGAIVFATGPVTIGVVPTETGAAVARAWASAAATVLLVPVVWAAIIAVGSVLIGDATTAGPLVGGNSAVGQLLGGVIVAVAGAATLWLCLNASREAAHVLRAQIGGAVASAGRGRTAPAQTAPSRPARGPQALRGFQGQIQQAARASGRPGVAGAGQVSTTQTSGSVAKSVGSGRLGRGVTVAGGAIRVGARTAGRTLTRVAREASGDTAADRQSPARRRLSSVRGQATAPQSTARAVPQRPAGSARRAATGSRPDSTAKAPKASAGAPAQAPGDRTKRTSARRTDRVTAKAAASTSPPTTAGGRSQPAIPTKATRKAVAAAKSAASTQPSGRRLPTANQGPVVTGRGDSPASRQVRPASPRPTRPSQGQPPTNNSAGRSGSDAPSRPAAPQRQRRTPAAPAPDAQGRVAPRSPRQSSTTDWPQRAQPGVPAPRASRSWRLRIGRRES